MSTFRSPWEVASRDHRNKVYGVVVAIVTDNKDPSGKYRVKVRYPCFANGDNETSGWARVCTFNAGKDRGMLCLPENGDEVLIAFEHGEVNRPIVVGSLWNNSDAPHGDNKSGKNNLRTFKSRSGHMLEFCDDKDNKKERVTLKTKAGHRICLDDADGGNKIEIYDSKSENYLLIDTQGKKITMESKQGEILIKAKEKIRLEAKTIETKSDKDTVMEVGQNFKTQAKQSEHKASQGTNLDGGTEVVVKGSTIKLN